METGNEASSPLLFWCMGGNLGMRLALLCMGGGGGEPGNEASSVVHGGGGGGNEASSVVHGGGGAWEMRLALLCMGAGNEASSVVHGGWE